jgi:hypothetical protein
MISTLRGRRGFTPRIDGVRRQRRVVSANELWCSRFHSHSPPEARLFDARFVPTTSPARFVVDIDIAGHSGSWGAGRPLGGLTGGTAGESGLRWLELPRRGVPARPSVLDSGGSEVGSPSTMATTSCSMFATRRRLTPKSWSLQFVMAGLAPVSPKTPNIACSVATAAGSPLPLNPTSVPDSRSSVPSRLARAHTRRWPGHLGNSVPGRASWNALRLRGFGSEGHRRARPTPQMSRRPPPPRQRPRPVAMDGQVRIRKVVMRVLHRVG